MSDPTEYSYADLDYATNKGLTVLGHALLHPFMIDINKIYYTVIIELVHKHVDIGRNSKRFICNTKS